MKHAHVCNLFIKDAAITEHEDLISVCECLCAKCNIFSVIELFFNYKEKQSKSNTGNERVTETDPVHYSVLL